MEMCASAPARAPRCPEALSRPQTLAAAYAISREMRIQLRLAARADDDDVAVALVAPRAADQQHSAWNCGSHRQRTQDADVDSRMPARSVSAERARDHADRRPHRMRMGHGRGSCTQERKEDREPHEVGESSTGFNSV